MKQRQIKTKLFANEQTTKAFITPAWQQHADLVAHLSQFSQNILLAIAPQGGGKTTFTQHFLNMQTPKLHKVSVKAQIDQTVEELIADVVEGFNLPFEGVDIAYDRIQACLEETYQKHQATWVLLVDDAHLLSDEQIQALLTLIQFEAEPRKQLHLVFIAEPSLELRLFSPEFASTIHGKIYTIELESWTLKDLNTYFAKEAVSPRLTSDQIAMIFERSRGLPGFVMREREALIGQPTTTVGFKMPHFDLKALKSHPIAIGVLVGTVLGGSYLIFNSASMEEENAAIPVNMAQLAEDRWETENNAPQKSGSVAFQFDKTDKAPVLAEVKTTPSLEKENPLPLQAEANVTTPEVVNTTVTEEKPVKKAPKKESYPIATMSVPVPDDVDVAEAEVVPVEAPKKVVKQVQQAQKTLTAKEERVLTADKGRYTLQLLGARSEESVKQFIQHHAIKDKGQYYRTKLSGKDWYVVVYGDYPSKEAAKAAINQIPASLKDGKLQPWVRELKTVQDESQRSEG